MPRDRQHSHDEDPDLCQRRVLPLLVAIRGRASGALLPRLLQAAVGSRVRSDVAREQQQCSQRAHLLVNQRPVQAAVRSACLQTLLFQTALCSFH